MVLVPLLLKGGELQAKETFASAVAIIFPICAVSFAAQLFFTDFSWAAAAPYLIGGAAGGLVGGWIGGKLYGRVSVKWLKWLFAGFLFYAGVKYLL